MKFRGYNAKRDANEGEIVKALRAIGATVFMHSGKDEPDLVVGFRGKNYLLEVKTDQGKLTKGQLEWHDNWKGQCCAVRTSAQAISIVTA